MDQIWWNHIIKAHAFLENIVKEAAGGHSLLLTLPDSVPWKSTFLDLIREQLLMENPKNKLEVIECPEEEPGEFILQKYCKRETRAKYRYGMSYAQFLGKCQETVLNDRYIWVSDIPDEKVTKWLDFVSEYQKNVQDKTPGIFILEVYNDAMISQPNILPTPPQASAAPRLIIKVAYLLFLLSTFFNSASNCSIV